MPTVAAVTPSYLLEVPETDWPVGSVATLFAPTPVDRGIWADPALVSKFVKRSNGNWVSYPGSDIYYPSLAALALAVPVMEVAKPAVAVAADPGAPTAAVADVPPAGDIYYMATTYTAPAGPDVGDVADAPGAPRDFGAMLRRFAPWLAGAALLFFVTRRR